MVRCVRLTGHKSWLNVLLDIEDVNQIYIYEDLRYVHCGNQVLKDKTNLELFEEAFQ